MAEESINPLITPEKNESNSTEMDSNSAENPRSSNASNGSCNIEDNARTYSSNEKQDRVNTTKRRVPIYLRASTGSCHDICKYGKHHAFEEKIRESFRKRISKSSPKEAKSIKTLVSENKQEEEKIEEKAIEPLRTRISKTTSPKEVKSVKMRVPGGKNKEQVVTKDEPSADYTKQHSLSNSIKISPRTKSCSPKLLYNSPRQSAFSRNKPRLPNLSPAEKSSSISEVTEVIKREILLPSEKVEVLVKEGISSESKISRADKKTCDQSSSARSKLIKVKPLIASGNSYGVQTGRKMTSLMMSADKASEKSYARLSTPRLSLGKIASSKAREAGRVKSSSPLKYRNGTGKSNCEGSEKILHVTKTEIGDNALNPKGRKAGRVKSSSSPLNRRKGTEKSNGEDDSEKTLHVIKTEADNYALSSSSSSISLSHEKKEDNEKIKNSGNEVDEIGNISAVKENHTRAKSPSSSSHEDDDDDEKIDYRNNEADELISDKIISSEIENSQSLKENHDMTTSSSSHEEDDDDEEIYPSSSSSSESSSESSSHAKSSSLSSHEENDEEMNGDEFVSDKTISMEIDKVQSPKENRKTLKKSRLVISDDQNCSPVKLKFRRGKIIDLQLENNVPKRLRFRRARIGGNKMDDFASDSKKSLETGNVKPVTPNKTLRKTDSIISDNKKSMEIVKPGTPNKPLRKSRSAVSEDKYPSPVNLIRREKTVDLHTANKSPTRLKFTRSRVPRAEDGKSDLRKKAIKKAGSRNDAVGYELSSRKVVLKHQEVQRKKHDQVLLNNVIEETASKLVESRKSKVKALVGAFETVISLQEPKPSSH